MLGRSAAWRRMALTEIMNSLSKFGPAAYSTSPLSLSLSSLLVYVSPLSRSALTEKLDVRS